MSDSEDESRSQPGELDAAPVVTTDDVATEADVIGFQRSENVTTRRSSGFANPPADNSRPSFSPLQSARGPADEESQHEYQCNYWKNKIVSFFSEHPLGEMHAKSFMEHCQEPLPDVPPCEELSAFVEKPAKEISDDDIYGVQEILQNCKEVYAGICRALKNEAKEASDAKTRKEESRRSSIGSLDKQPLAFFKPKVLNHNVEKIIHDVTHKEDLSEAQFWSTVKFFKNPGSSNWGGIFELFTSSSGTIDPKWLGGHLDCLYEFPGANSFGDEISDEDETADVTSNYISISSKPIFNAKTSTSMPTGQRWSYLKRDLETRLLELDEIENKIKRQNLKNRVINEHGYTVMHPPLEIFFALKARGDIGYWFARRFLNRFENFKDALNVSDWATRKLDSLKLDYEKLFHAEALQRLGRPEDFPHHEKPTVKSMVANMLYPNLNIGVNLLIDVANIVNQVDMRENMSNLGQFVSSLSLKESDSIAQLANLAEVERKRLAEHSWHVVPQKLAELSGISFSSETGVPKMLENSDFIHAYLLYQAYNYRGPDNGHGGLHTAKKALIGSIQSVCGIKIVNDEDPIDEIPTGSLKDVFEKFTQAPSKFGLVIDPKIPVERITFHDSGRQISAGFAGIEHPETDLGLVGVTPQRQPFTGGGGNRAKTFTGAGGNSSPQQRGRSTNKSNDAGEANRTKSVANKMKNPSYSTAFGKEVAAAGNNFVNAEARIQLLVDHFKQLRTSDDNFQNKFSFSPFKELRNGKIQFPPLPCFEGKHPLHFFSFNRDPENVRPPLQLYIRYCVYADMFRLTQDGQLTTFGEAYMKTTDPTWGQVTQQFANEHSTYKYKDRGASGGGASGGGPGGNGKGYKNGGGGRKGFKKN